MQTGTEVGDSRLPLAFVAQLTGRLRVPQLPFGFEPMLLVTARFLSLREPNRVGFFRDRRRGWGCALQL